MPATVIASASFAAGLKTEFLNTYRRRVTAVNARLNRVMRLGIPSTRDQETYFYWESAPHARRRRKGEARQSKPFDGISFTIANHNFQTAVHWFDQDRDDDQTRSMMQQAQDGGASLAILPERIFFQLVTGATDAALLPAVPNAPDGSAMYATTAGGAARFGVTGGNVVTGTGVATAGAVRQDVFNNIERMGQFQDTEGQPYYDLAELKTFVLVFNSSNWQVVGEALLQTPTVAAVGAAAADGIGNIVQQAGFNIELWPTSRITDNDMFLFNTDTEHRSTFQQVRQPLETLTQTKANSDEARKTDIEGVFWENRNGYGISIPINTVQINN